MSELQGHQEGIPAATNTIHTTTTTTTTRTILRIKRRRTESPIPCIRLEGLNTNIPTVPESVGGRGERGFGGHNKYEEGKNKYSNTSFLQNEKGNSHESGSNNNLKRPSAVLWKRFDPNNNNNDDDERRNEHGENYRIVDAMLVAEEEEDDDDVDNELIRKGVNNGYDVEENLLHYGDRRSKRRKLTLLDSSTLTSTTPIADTVEKLMAGGTSASTSTSKNSILSTSSLSPSNKSTTAVLQNTNHRKKKEKALKVLDPLTRIVDDSLKEVLIGEKTVELHYRQLTTDPIFTLRSISSQRKWMAWNLNYSGNGDGGNILHCCALWNDASIVNDLLQRFVGDVGSALMEAVDSDGRTPYEVAQLVGHTRVCEVLEIYGGDTTNYVYDVFYLDDKNINRNGDAAIASSRSSSRKNDPMMPTSSTDEVVEDDDDDEDGPVGIMTAELTSGVGYWTPEGELILETADERHTRSFSEETDGDIDSNCEEYGGNDYPDEDDDGQYDDDCNDHDLYRVCDNHHRPVDRNNNDNGVFTDETRTMIQQQQQRRVHNYDNENYEFSDDDNNDEYDWEEDLTDEMDQYRTSNAFES